MKPLTTIQAKIYAAKFCSGPFSYFNVTHKRNYTAILTITRKHKNAPHSNRNEFNYIEQLASEYLERLNQVNEQHYIETRLPYLSADQISIIASAVREMLR